MKVPHLRHFRLRFLGFGTACSAPERDAVEGESAIMCGVLRVSEIDAKVGLPLAARSVCCYERRFFYSLPPN